MNKNDDKRFFFVDTIGFYVNVLLLLYETKMETIKNKIEMEIKIVFDKYIFDKITSNLFVFCPFW